MPPPLPVLLLSATLALLSSQTIASVLTSTGSTIELGDIQYYVSSTPSASIPSTFYSQGLANANSIGTPWIPVTVVNPTPGTFATAELQTTFHSFSAIDDVWTPSFLTGILIQGSSPYPTNTNITTTFTGADAPSLISTLPSSSPSIPIPPGPYLLSPQGLLYEPHRLYADTEGAFTQPLTRASGADGSAALSPSTHPPTYVPLPATVPGIASPGIAVPSRLYFTKTEEKPLAGVRTGIKDIFDVKGVKTGDGNRAFYALYEPRGESAEVVGRLEEAGAIIVGKMKTSQFANGETATADWVDYHEPFNPRGDGETTLSLLFSMSFSLYKTPQDHRNPLSSSCRYIANLNGEKSGYQDTSSSSSGPGSGAGSYPWLDLTLGSDTGGSIRGPAQVQGVYGNRPTHALVELTGAMPLAPELDTAGFLCRDPTIWTSAARVLYAGAITFPTAYPSKLQTIGFPTAETIPADETIAQTNALLLSFLSKIEGFLNTNATALNYTASWTQTKPDPTYPGLDVFLNRTYPTLISKEQTKNVRDPFYRDYGARFDGRVPFVDPVPRARWAFGDSLPASELDVAVGNKTVFKEWWEGHVLPPGRNETSEGSCSDSLVLYSEGVNIVYRNKYLNDPVPPFGFDDSQITIFAEVPDFAIPIGEASYQSTITNHTEVLPVSVDIIAARGCDGLIFKLVEALLAEGIVKIPLAGQTAEGGEILVR